MWEEGEEAVEVAFDGEIEAPPPVDPGLPDASGLIVLLGPEGGVAEVLKEEGDPAVNRPLDPWGSARVVLEEALGVEGPHGYRFLGLLASWWSERIMSFADENGP